MPRRHPPRAVASLPAGPLPTVADCLRMRALIDLHHEYPGETFLVVDDDMRAIAGKGGHERSWLAGVAAGLALGIVASKAVLFRQSQLPEVWRLLWHLRTDEILVVKPALLFAATCLILRATTMAARRSQLPASGQARRLARRCKNIDGEPLLVGPLVRVLDEPVAPGTAVVGGAAVARAAGSAGSAVSAGVDVAELVSPFEPSPLIEARLRDLCASAHLRDGGAGAGACAARAASLQTLHARLTGTPVGAEPVGDEALVRAVVRAIEDRFGAAVSRCDALRRHPDDVHDVLREGASLARREAEETLALIEDDRIEVAS